MFKFGKKDLGMTGDESELISHPEDVADYETLPRLSLSKFSVTQDQLELLAIGDHTGLNSSVMKTIDAIRKAHRYAAIFPSGGANAPKIVHALTELIRQCKQENVETPGVYVGLSAGAIASLVGFICGSCEEALRKADHLADLFQGVVSWGLLADISSKKPDGSPFRQKGGIVTFDKMIDWFTSRVLELLEIREKNDGQAAAGLLVMVAYDLMSNQHRYFFFTDPQTPEGIKTMVTVMAASSTIPKVVTKLRIMDSDTGKVHDFDDRGYSGVDVARAIIEKDGKVLAFPAYGHGPIARRLWDDYRDDDNTLEIDLKGKDVPISDFASFAVFSPRTAAVGKQVVSQKFREIKDFLES